MTNIDQFESVFNAAARDVFRLREIPLDHLMVVCDLDDEGADKFERGVRRFLGNVLPEKVEITRLASGDYDDAGALLQIVEEQRPDLVCAYRNLKSKHFRYPYSLGTFLNVLTRETEPPVLLVPHPQLEPGYAWTGKNTDRVLVVTDHLSGDERLVNYGARFTERAGTLFLAHVEDEASFERFIRAIGKIPSIDTENAREEIQKRLLKDPAEYIEGCREVLRKSRPELTVTGIVELGHHITDYRRIVEAQQIDLLILRTIDDDTGAFALQGASYALSVLLNQVPMLLL